MYMPVMLCTLKFIREQGYETECVGLYQDNIRNQLLIKNGKLSGRKKTKHIKFKFFFIKDRVDSREIRVIDCPAEEMWADAQTKPLQGMAIRKIRAELVNCPVNYEENNKPAEKPAIHLRPQPGTGMKTANKRLASTSPQECVGHRRTRVPVTDRWIRVARNVRTERLRGRSEQNTTTRAE
jgi:hypothetical protein